MPRRMKPHPRKRYPKASPVAGRLTPEQERVEREIRRSLTDRIDELVAGAVERHRRVTP